MLDKDSRTYLEIWINWTSEKEMQDKRKSTLRKERAISMGQLAFCSLVHTVLPYTGVKPDDRLPIHKHKIVCILLRLDYQVAYQHTEQLSGFLLLPTHMKVKFIFKEDYKNRDGRVISQIMLTLFKGLGIIFENQSLQEFYYPLEINIPLRYEIGRAHV